MAGCGLRGCVTLDKQCIAIGLPAPQTELRFAPPRRWRFDLAWPDRKLACEVDGAIWTQGRHTRGAGVERDMEKYNAAALDGWRVLRVSTGMVRDGRALKVLEAALR
jgi:very-short-patch-repair endonuclease